jgi:hypothetical protein
MRRDRNCGAVDHPDLASVMRHADKTELHGAMLLFLVLTPMAYFTVRGLVALAS